MLYIDGEKIKDIHSNSRLIAGTIGGDFVYLYKPPTPILKLSDLESSSYFVADLTNKNQTAKTSFKYYDGSCAYFGYATVKLQGNTSLIYPKKNYNVTFYKDSECTVPLNTYFSNWGEFNKYTLKADYIDATLLRNVTCAKIWGEMVERRSYYSTLSYYMINTPNYGAINGFVSELKLNGETWGQFSLTTGKTYFTFNKNCTAAICSENYMSGCFAYYSYFEKDYDWTLEYSYYYNEESFSTSAPAAYFNEAIRLCSASNQEFKDNVWKYLDKESVIDYYIFGFVFGHIDGFGKNQMYLNYGSKWYASVYDMDGTDGLYWDGSKILPTDIKFQDDYETKQTSEIPRSLEGNLLYNKLLENYADDILERYDYLRVTLLNDFFLDNIIDTYYDTFDDELTAKERAKWPNVPSKNITSVQQVKDWIHARLLYADDHITDYNRPSTGSFNADFNNDFS